MAPDPVRQPATTPVLAWHALAVSAVFEHLASSPEGLSEREVSLRRERDGPNALPEPTQTSLGRLFVRQFVSPLIYLLLVAAVIACAMGELSDAVVIVAVVLINAVIGTLQERRAQRSMAELRQIAAVRCRVSRAGQEQTVGARELVSGDVLMLAAGDAGARIARVVGRGDPKVGRARGLELRYVAPAWTACLSRDVDGTRAERERLMNRLEGKVAIITGATGGIGRTTAKLFVHEGAQVMLVDRDTDTLQALCSELGSRARYEEADVCHPGDNERFVETAVAHFGGVDILFANAGIEGTVGPLTELSPEVFERVWSVNVMGPFLGIKYAAPALAKRGGGSIVITSSIAGLIATRGLGAYCTSKHALSGLARTAALELAAQNIRVNTIHPGPIDNRMMRSVEDQAAPGHPDDVKHGFEAQIALGRYGTNEEVANLALFLASKESSYCTGSQFVADGGFTAQ